MKKAIVVEGNLKEVADKLEQAIIATSHHNPNLFVSTAKVALDGKVYVRHFRHGMTEFMNGSIYNLKQEQLGEIDWRITGEAVDFFALFHLRTGESGRGR